MKPAVPVSLGKFSQTVPVFLWNVRPQSYEGASSMRSTGHGRTWGAS